MELSFKVNKPVDYIFDLLTDMQQFVSVHPVISRIDTIAANDYLIHETLRLGLVPVSFTYKATIDADIKNKKLVMRATVMKITKVEMRYELYGDNECTIINERITFTSPLPVKLLENIFRKQHTQLFKNIAALN